MNERRYDHLQLGHAGEARAATWYSDRGYKILTRNWRCSHGEIDLIVARDSEVVFVEVKTRSSDRYGSPLEAVGHKKRHKLRTLAAAWLSENRGDGHRDVRFDVVAVVGTRVDVRQSAF